MKYLIGAVSLGGNKGAAAMAESLIANISKRDADAEFAILTYYPRSDRPHAERLGRKVTLLDGSPRSTVLKFVVSILAWPLRLAGLKTEKFLAGDMKKIAQCNVWLDAAGISFCDGREKFLIYNVLNLIPAFACGIPVIKVPQALGPFKNPLNRLCAKLVLPRIKLVAARGAVTRNFLDSLGLANVKDYPDSAFSLPTTAEDNAAAESIIGKAGTERGLICVSPSQVVWKLMGGEKSENYLSVLRDFTLACVKKGYKCVVFPHSARAGSTKTHNNDLPVVRRFAGMLPQSDMIKVVTDELPPGVLRRITAHATILAASRFHALISAMATGVPAVAIGWSHKYGEVLSRFGMEKYAIQCNELTLERLERSTDELLADREALSKNIKNVMKAIIAENENFFDETLEIARGGKK